MKIIRSIALQLCLFTFMVQVVHGGDLSEAMEKASDGHHGARTVHGGRTRHHANAPDAFGCLLFSLEALALMADERPSGDELRLEERDKAGEESQFKTAKSENDTDQTKAHHGVLSFAAGSGVFKGDDLYPMAHLDVSFGGYSSEYTRPELYVGMGFSDVDESESIDNAIRGTVSFFSLGFRIKHYTTPLEHPVGYYFVGGLALTTMQWQYENAIYVDDREIKHDTLNGIEASCGVGFQLAQTRNTQIGIEVLPTVIWWNNVTDEGFDNDIFGDPLMLKIRLVFSWLWGL